jgi:uncharacterized protein YraI
MKTTLLAAASALVLSAGVASAAPAITKSTVTMRAGPGPQYPIVMRVPARAAVDVEGCNSGWCEVNWNGADGYVNAGALRLAGAPGPAVSSRSYYYDEEPDYGVYVAPGFYGPAYGYRHHRQSNDGGRWQRGPGRPTATARPGAPQPGFAGPPANWRGNPGIGQRTPPVNAPAGLRSGGPGFGAPLATGPAAAPGAPPAAAPAPAPAAPGNSGFGPPLAR